MLSFEKARAVMFDGLPVLTGNRSEIFVRMLVGLYFLSPILFVSIETSPTALAIVAAVISVASLSTKRGYLTRGTMTLAVVLAILFGFVLLSALWSVDPARSVRAARDVLGYSAAALVLAQCILAIPVAQCDRLLQAFSVGVLVALSILIGRELYFAFATEDPRLVYHVVTLHKITFYGAFFATILIARPSLFSKAFAAFFAIVTLLYGRSTGVNLAIVVVALFFATPARFRQRALVFFVVFYAVLAFVAPFVATPLFAFLDTRGWMSFYPGTFAARLELWKMISDHVAEAPILGHGANTTRNAIGVVVNPKYYALPDLASAHNIVFDLWYELGVAGIAVYGLLLMGITRMIGRLTGASHFIAGSYLIIAIIELSVDHRIWLSWVLGVLAFTASVCVLHHRSSSARPGTSET
ncbi:O-antigen ligase family protein [Mesorhizobium sp. AR10]|uniref:O-antigen ligase family protein n=1 Tax=Mesorhizobium sp. AR10 TaxID=2865839 RepID=UPI00215FF114|nr:O-antigen ligase family protein [Mesorhizobium sp. AR10]UVK38205.1 O-antigen ligase family protein [Mesorhizobium sp. AR10]